MNIQIISVPGVVISLVMAITVVIICKYASMPVKDLWVGLARMVIQLAAVGFILQYIFAAEHYAVVLAILFIMLLAAGWIAMRPVKHLRKKLFYYALVSIASGGIITLIIVVFAVLKLNPWYQARYLIPIAGMIFASSMNGVSLAADRLLAELGAGKSYVEARSQALQTALLPTTNMLVAVGIVSLPGMMTGQILSGVSPFIAVRYQIMIMCMILASGGISSLLFLLVIKKVLSNCANVKSNNN